VKSFAKYLAHDDTLERCVSLVPKRHTLLSRALNLPKIQFVVLNDRFQYSDLEAPGVCRTQSCDPPRGLEVIRGMSNTMVSKLWGV
jgi:hypothetical protein